MHRVPFVSQYDTAYPYGTCGVAATMMLLRFHYRRKPVPSHRDLRKALGIHLTPADKNHHYDRTPGFGVSTEAVITYLMASGVRYRATYLKSRRQLRIVLGRLRHAPLMVAVRYGEDRWGPDGHWIVLIDATATTVTYLDSAFRRSRERPCRMRMSTFRRDWDGCSVQIVGFH